MTVRWVGPSTFRVPTQQRPTHPLSPPSIPKPSLGPTRPSSFANSHTHTHCDSPLGPNYPLSLPPRSTRPPAPTVPSPTTPSLTPTHTPFSPAPPRASRSSKVGRSRLTQARREVKLFTCERAGAGNCFVDGFFRTRIVLGELVRAGSWHHPPGGEQGSEPRPIRYL